VSQSPSEVLIRTRGLSKIFKAARGEVRALSGIDLEILKGEYVSIMGPSGSGKSTLFNMIGALDRPTSGSIAIDDIELSSLNSRQLAYFRGRHLGYIFQSYNLLASMTAVKNVMLPLLLAGAEQKQSYEQARIALEEVGLGHRLDHRPGELSGGQQQRVAIARAIVSNPTILLADEPTANLDLQTGMQIIQMIRDLSQSRNMTVVSATHDHEMLKVSDRVIWIEDGRIARIAHRSQLQIESGQLH
jgi:putative ABC transport system ATP-binding protein